VDRKSLPDPELTDMTAEYVAPRNATEQALADIWQDLLGVERVGIYDNFFELGGHSLLAMRVVSAIRKELDIELSIRDLFVYPMIAGLGAYLNEQGKGNLLPAIVVAKRPEHIPLSFSQERLWFLDRLEGSLQYHLPAVLRLKGELNKEALEQTLQTIINRHEVLRTVILEHEGRGYQHLLPPDSWTLGIIAEPGYKEETEGLSSFIAGLISKPFDLSGDYMLRADLIRLNQDDHILVVNMHHIASDGWSTSILVKEVIALYEGYANHTELPSLRIQYADYAIWQRNYLQGEVLENKLGYWKEKLTGVAPLQLPADFNRPAIQSSRGAIHNFKIEQRLSLQLVDLSHRHGTTLYMTLLSAFKVLLYRYSGQEDICVGTPIAGRNQQELESLIGFFINTLALRSQVSGDMSFTTLLADVKRMTLEAYGHQEVPFEKVVDVVMKERDMSRNPLFQVLFSLQNTPEVPELKLGELSLSAENQGHTTSKFDLAFMIVETNLGIQAMVEYCTDLYKEETIDRMVSHYLNLLESIAASPENPVSRLGMLNDVEEHTLLMDFNDTAAVYPKDKTIVTLFEEQVAKNPEVIALVFGQDWLTYKELNERSNRLAHYLQKQGVKAETLVPVCMERSINMVVGILGIMKAGGAYIPVDPSYPEDRIRYMLEDTGASIVLSNTANGEKLGESSIPVIELDSDWELISGQSSADIDDKPSADQLAYVIYTSGSTGKPKGVMIEHHSLVNLVAWHNREYEVTETSKATSMAGVGFDAFGWEIWPYLSAGASIHIIDNDTRLSAAALSALFIDEHITHSFVSTALVPDFIESSRHKTVSLKYLLTGGDKLSAVNLDGITYTLVNNYGPTENTVVATNCIVSQNDKVLPIGKPISNTQIHILSSDGELSPIGVPGEIYIGGASLARGYLNRPDLTAEKFNADPFSKEPGARVYKTGDLGRWLPDGNIEYMGRIDDQVKIRGFRIELGEIESVLNQHSGIQQAVVLAKEDKQGTKRLAGYVVAEGEFDKQAIQAYLSTKLPDYMVPALWVELESIPLTPNGKIDRKALPDPDLQSIITEYVAPRNATEQALANIWQELLGLERIGIHDNFFELGGHSLLAMRVVSYIERELSVSIPIQMLFQFTSISDLSKYLEFEIQTIDNLKERNSDEFDEVDL
jgi:amino acid adenylation domain-containing protein